MGRCLVMIAQEKIMIFMDVGNTDSNSLHRIVQKINVMRANCYDTTLERVCDEWRVQDIPGGARLTLEGHEELTDKETEKTTKGFASETSRRMAADVRMVMTPVADNVFAPGSRFTYVAYASGGLAWKETHQMAQAISLLKDCFSVVKIAALADEKAALYPKWAQGMLWLGVEQQDTQMIQAAELCGADLRARDFMGSAPLARLAEDAQAPDDVRELARSLLPTRYGVRPG